MSKSPTNTRARDRLGKCPTINTKRDSTLPPLPTPFSKGDRKTMHMGQGKFHELFETTELPVPESGLAGTTVAIGLRKADGVEVVIKTKTKKDAFADREEEMEWVETMLVQLNMPKVENICQVLDVVETEHSYHVVMEKAEGQDLFEQFKKERPKAEEVKVIMKQILEAVKTLHDAGRVHRDLKLENVMIQNGVDSPAEPSSPKSPTAVVKLIDFDTVATWESDSPRSPKVVGTCQYNAPETYDGIFTPASDVFCIGVIMYRLLTGKFPLHRDLVNDVEAGEDFLVGGAAMNRMKERVQSAKINFKRVKDERAADLCTKMLEREPKARCTVAEALAHDWLADNAVDGAGTNVSLPPI